MLKDSMNRSTTHSVLICRGMNVSFQFRDCRGEGGGYMCVLFLSPFEGKTVRLFQESRGALVLSCLRLIFYFTFFFVARFTDKKTE